MVQALEHQYRRGLLCINEELPQTEVSLVFKQGRLQFEPSLEVLKTAHYKQLLKPFLSIPLNFKVEGDAVFSGMVANSKLLLILPFQSPQVEMRPLRRGHHLFSSCLAVSGASLQPPYRDAVFSKPSSQHVKVNLTQPCFRMMLC